MRKILIVVFVAVLLILASASIAFAGDSGVKGGVAGDGSLAAGLQGNGGLFDNPGEMFHVLKEMGYNPAQWAKSDNAPAADTLGEWLYTRSHNPHVN